MSNHVIAVVIHGFGEHHRAFAGNLMSTVKQTCRQLTPTQHDIHWLPVNIDWINELRATEDNDPLRLTSRVMPLSATSALSLAAQVNVCNAVFLNTSLQAVIEEKVQDLITESCGALTKKTPVIIASGQDGKMTLFQFSWHSAQQNKGATSSPGYRSVPDFMLNSANDNTIHHKRFQ